MLWGRSRRRLRCFCMEQRRRTGDASTTSAAALVGYPVIIVISYISHGASCASEVANLHHRDREAFTAVPFPPAAHRPAVASPSPVTTVSIPAIIRILQGSLRRDLEWQHREQQQRHGGRSGTGACSAANL